MKITVEKLPKHQVKLRIEVPADKMHLFREKAAEDISREVKVPGFREGHVPPNVMETHVGPEVFRREVIQVALPYTYAEAIQHEKLEPIINPKVTIITEEPLVYEAVFATLPDIEIKEYKSVKVPKKEIKVEKKEIDEVINDVRKRESKFKPVDHPAKKGDRVEIDFEGFDEGGASLDKTSSKNHPLIVGDGTLIEDFEKELIGVKTGEKKEFDVTFPKDYGHAPFQNKKVHFKVEVKKVEEVELPELTDELIESVSGKKQTVDELKKVIETNLLLKKQDEERQRRENELLEAFLKIAKVDVPDILIEDELVYMMEDLKADLAEKKLDFKTFLEQSKKTEEELQKSYMPEAEKRVKLRLTLQHIFKEEKIAVSDEEVQKEITAGVMMYPEEYREKMKKQYDENPNLRVQLKNRMMLAHLFDGFLKGE